MEQPARTLLLVCNVLSKSEAPWRTPAFGPTVSKPACFPYEPNRAGRHVQYKCGKQSDAKPVCKASPNAYLIQRQWHAAPGRNWSAMEREEGL